MKTIRQWVEENLNNFSDKIEAMKKCSKDLKVQYTTVKSSFSKNKFWENKSKPIKQTSKPKGRSLQEFKSTFDKNTIIPQKIKKALKELGNGWEYENEFIKRAGINYTDLNMFKSEFEDYFIFLTKQHKKIWCGTIEMINQLKELI